MVRLLGSNREFRDRSQPESSALKQRKTDSNEWHTQRRLCVAAGSGQPLRVFGNMKRVLERHLAMVAEDKRRGVR